MYDCSTEFRKFYREEVVLPQETQQQLRDKRDLNIQRLKDGLQLLNEEEGTNYKIAETQTQGSMAMHTIVQNDDKDYDIDVAIVFEKDNLDGLSPLQTRRLVANALEKKTKQLASPPEVKTSCVRLRYAAGYHVDFAIFRRYKENPEDSEYIYEHAGSDWSLRDLKGIVDWFKEEIAENGETLRQQVRLLKMFCRSRSDWRMPSGLIQSILIDENLDTSSRLDEAFYNTLKKVVNRLTLSIEVNAPVDNNRHLTDRQSDKDRATNLKTRLSKYLNKLEILFDNSCTYEQAIEAWSSFFNHEYWNQCTDSANKNYTFHDTEEFIEEKFPVNLQHKIRLETTLSGDGFRPQTFKEFFNSVRHFIPHNLTIQCKVLGTSVPEPFDIFWKVRNVGEVAEKKDKIRGQIINRGISIHEPTSFFGYHYIECYIIKDGECVAIQRVEVPIE